MTFSAKSKSIQTDNSYTIEEFYDAIKGHNFSAGEPSLTKHGAVNVITFPALDRQNQIWICPEGSSPKVHNFSVQKSEAAGISVRAANIALDNITNGLFGVGRMVGKNAKECERLVDKTAEELAALSL